MWGTKRREIGEGIQRELRLSENGFQVFSVAAEFMRMLPELQKV
jgi:hypothetical protein